MLMRAAAVAVLFALSGIFAGESALAGKGGGGKSGGGMWGGVKSAPQSRPQASSHPHGSGHHRHGGHHHHHKNFVGVGVGFGYPWGWWYPPPYYYYYPYPVAYPFQPVTYIEQGGAPASVEPAGWWYYCETSTSYYPYVKECPAGWERVPAQAR
jgi:hypothetical protein